MKKRRWSKEETDFLIDNYKTLSIQEIVDKLQRSEDSVRWQASYCGLTDDKPKAYTPIEVDYIRENMGKVPIYKMALHLGRSAKGVKNQITKLKQMEAVKNHEQTAEFEFDRNVPFGVGKHYEFKTMLNSMDVGDSFEYLQSERATMLNVISLFDEKIFKTKKIDETTRRVWRLF